MRVSAPGFGGEECVPKRDVNSFILHVYPKLGERLRSERTFLMGSPFGPRRRVQKRQKGRIRPELISGLGPLLRKRPDGPL